MINICLTARPCPLVILVGPQALDHVLQHKADKPHKRGVASHMDLFSPLLCTCRRTWSEGPIAQASHKAEFVSLRLRSQEFLQRLQTRLYFATMSRIERKSCLISTSYLAGFFDIFTLLHIWQNCVCFVDFLHAVRTLCDAYHKEFECN